MMIPKKQRRRKQKIIEPYTKATAITQVIMTICAGRFSWHLFLSLFNYSFQNKKRIISGTVPLSHYRRALNFENYVNAFEEA